MKKTGISLLLLFGIYSVTSAQHPGGISLPVLWLESEAEQSTGCNLNGHPVTDTRSAGWYSNADSLARTTERCTLFAVVQSSKDYTLSQPQVLTYLSSIRRSHSLWNGQQEYAADLSFLSGYCPELVGYDRILSPMECRRVESYLAIKYGITLKSSYYGSDGRILWDADALQKYHHRVTAIGWDAGNRLFQHTSVTADKDSLLLTISRTDTAGLASGSYLIVGDNNGTLTTTVDEESPWHICGRQWAVSAISDTLHLKTSRQIYAGNRICLNFQPSDNCEFLKMDTRRIFLLIDNESENGDAVTETRRIPCSERTDCTLTFENITWSEGSNGRIQLAWYDGNLNDLLSGKAAARQDNHGGKSADQATDIGSGMKTSSMTVLQVGNSNSYTARLVTPVRCDATLAVFNSSGQKILERSFVSGKDRTLSFTLPGSGIYIVKAVMPEEELSQKIIRK